MKIGRKREAPGDLVSKVAAELDKELPPALPQIPNNTRGKYELYFTDGKTKTLLVTQDATLSAASGGTTEMVFRIRIA